MAAGDDPAAVPVLVHRLQPGARSRGAIVRPAGREAVALLVTGLRGDRRPDVPACRRPGLRARTRRGLVLPGTEAARHARRLGRAPPAPALPARRPGRRPRSTLLRRRRTSALREVPRATGHRHRSLPPPRAASGRGRGRSSRSSGRPGPSAARAAGAAAEVCRRPAALGTVTDATHQDENAPRKRPPHRQGSHEHRRSPPGPTPRAARRPGERPCGHRRRATRDGRQRRRTAGTHAGRRGRSPRLDWQPCGAGLEPFLCATRRGAAGLRPPARPDDDDRADPAARERRARGAHRHAVHQPRRARRQRRRVRPARRRVHLPPGRPRALRRSRLRPSRRRSLRPRDVLPHRREEELRRRCSRCRVPDHAARGGPVHARGPRARGAVPDHVPGAVRDRVDRERRARHGPAPPGRR